METKEDVNRESQTNFLPLIIMHPIVYAILTILTLFLIIFLFRGWSRTVYINSFFNIFSGITPPLPPYNILVGILAFFLIFWYYLILYSPFLIFVFVVYDIVRYILFLTKNEQTQEKANKLAGGSVGTHAYRIHVLLVLIPLIVFMEYSQIMMKLPAAPDAPGEVEFLYMYSRFQILLFIFMLFIIIAPHVLRFTADHTNRYFRKKFIVNSIVWPIIFVFLFFGDNIIILILAVAPFP